MEKELFQKIYNKIKIVLVIFIIPFLINFLLPMLFWYFLIRDRSYNLTSSMKKGEYIVIFLACVLLIAMMRYIRIKKYELACYVMGMIVCMVCQMVFIDKSGYRRDYILLGISVAGYLINIVRSVFISYCNHFDRNLIDQ